MGTWISYDDDDDDDDDDGDEVAENDQNYKDHDKYEDDLK